MKLLSEPVYKMLQVQGLSDIWSKITTLLVSILFRRFGAEARSIVVLSAKREDVNLSNILCLEYDRIEKNRTQQNRTEPVELFLCGQPPFFTLDTNTTLTYTVYTFTQNEMKRSKI